MAAANTWVDISVVHTNKASFFYTGLFGYATWRLLIVQKVKEGVDCTRTT